MNAFLPASSNAATAGFTSRRTHSSNQGSAKLNLVSLMDIFTILVFFLMVNTGDVEVLQADENIALPESFADLKPGNAPVIKVSTDGIYFKEQRVVELEQYQSDSSNASARSKSELASLHQDSLIGLYQALIAEQSATKNPQQGLSKRISVMGDAATPYSLLKQVLATCSDAGFQDVSLAVEYKTRVDSSAGPSA